MKQKAQTPEQKVDELCKDIVREIAHWNQLQEQGGQDQLWPDGVNMNLTRNHVIYDKRLIADLCADHGLELPEAYFLGTPPEVDDSYMANLRQKERVARLKQQGTKITLSCARYDADQTSIF